MHYFSDQLFVFLKIITVFLTAKKQRTLPIIVWMYKGHLFPFPQSVTVSPIFNIR